MSIPVEPIELPPTHGLGIRQRVPMTALSMFFAEAFHELEDVARKARARLAGPPFARTFAVLPYAVDVEAVVPVDRPLAEHGRAHPVALPGAPAVQVRHVGPYSRLGPAYDAIGAWLEDHHRAPGDAPREVFLTDPGAVADPEQWVTLVVQPLA